MIIYIDPYLFPDFVDVNAKGISIPIESTNELDEKLDDIRIAEGKRPFFKEIPGVENDFDAWYELELIIDRETGKPQEIEARTENCSADDAGVYNIEIDDVDETMSCLLKELKDFHMTIDDLKSIE